MSGAKAFVAHDTSALYEHLEQCPAKEPKTHDNILNNNTQQQSEQAPTEQEPLRVLNPEPHTPAVELKV